MSSIIVVVFIALLVVALIIFFVWLSHEKVRRYILDNFKHCNVIVSGKKRRGKDLVMNWVVNKRNEPYYANLCYTEYSHPKKHLNSRKEKLWQKLHDKKLALYNYIDCALISLAPNTFENFILGNIQHLDPTKRLFEKTDIYISDIGNYLPAQYDSFLHKNYKSLPLYYALNGHITDSNIHCNCQSIERAWKALREQADFFVNVKRTKILFGYWFITTGYTYEQYDSACHNLLPLKTKFLDNSQAKAIKEQYYATNGRIEKFTIIQTKKQLHYNTRAFEGLIYGADSQHYRNDRKFATRVSKIINRINRKQAIKSKINKLIVKFFNIKSR